MNRINRTRIYKGGIVLLLLSIIQINVAISQNWGSDELQQLYTDYLTAEGIENRVDSDGDIQFEVDGLSYYIEVVEEDTGFFRLVLFNIWPIESLNERQKVIIACDEVNRTMKVAKAYITEDDNVSISCELFLNEPGDFRFVFSRCLRAIEISVETFVEMM